MALTAALVVHRHADQPSGDPGGRIIAQLRPAVAALPPDARVLYRNDVEPRWDSCDGRPSTYGWDDVVVQVHFASATGPDAILADADAVLTSQRWSSIPLARMPDVVQQMWSKVITNGTTAKISLAEDQYGTNEWSLFASAPPQGQRVSGC